MLHFVTGGSFNGKLKWVLEYYKLTKLDDFYIFKCYQKKSKIKLVETVSIIISGLEHYLQLFEKTNKGRAEFHRELLSWIEWEQALDGRKLILIGSDISKGVVPISKDERQLRDFVGWCYQDIAKIADRVDIIWYGMANTIKQ